MDEGLLQWPALQHVIWHVASANTQVMVSQPEVARDLLRKGAFDGLRENVRALGEYAVTNGQAESSGPLVNNLFKALEGYDLVLARSVRCVLVKSPSWHT
jgi:hypothetical protein